MYDRRDVVNIDVTAEGYVYCVGCRGNVGRAFAETVELYQVTHTFVRNAYMGRRSFCNDLDCDVRRGIESYNDAHSASYFSLANAVVFNPHVTLSLGRMCVSGFDCVEPSARIMDRIRFGYELFNFNLDTTNVSDFPYDATFVALAASEPQLMRFPTNGTAHQCKQ